MTSGTCKEYFQKIEYRDSNILYSQCRSHRRTFRSRRDLFLNHWIGSLHNISAAHFFPIWRLDALRHGRSKENDESRHESADAPLVRNSLQESDEENAGAFKQT